MRKFMKRIAVITARGGSKRIPRKNIKPFLGRPILQYSIEAALAAGIFDEVMVSTEDKEIAEIAKRAGAAVPFFRSGKTAGDFATTADVIAEVLEEYKKRGQYFDELCCIYPTAPFLTGEILREAMAKLEDPGVESVMPVVKFSFPPQRSVILREGRLLSKWPECMPVRSQDLEPFYHDCGQFYCLKTSAFEQQQTLLMAHTSAYIMDEMLVQDIDTKEDWEIAERKYELHYGRPDGKTAACFIKGRPVGDGHPAYIIAEMSANHAGSLERAKEIIRAAKEAGADCIKIQTYTPDTLTLDCDSPYFQITEGTWKGENLYSLYGRAYTPWEWQPQLKAEADRIGIDFFSTPFDNTAVDFLEGMGVEFYKVASFEIVDIPLISYIASKGKPIIMSTGMATLEEIKEAAAAVKKAGNPNLILLKCSSAYPAVSKEMNLQTIAHMKAHFGIPIGLSDHSMGSLGAVAAVLLGANVIEKHFCLSREIDNPDASFSMTPEEFKAMVQDIRTVEKARGEVLYGASAQEEGSKKFRRSLFAAKDIRAGELLTAENIKSIRPAYGMKPKYYPLVLGKKAQMDILRGTPLQLGHIAALRNASMEDEALLLAWKNDETARKYALSSKETTPKEHSAWLQRVLQGEDIFLYIMQCGKEAVGQVRLEATGPECVISYSIDAGHRGCGYGTLLLLLAENEARKNTGAVRLCGIVHAKNEASVACFEKLGYQKSAYEGHADFIKFTKLLRVCAE